MPANQGPSPALRGLWLHEIKHDGFRVIARKDGPRVRLYSRPGNDLTRQFPLIVEALARLRSRSCIIDGEAVACDDNGIASFELIRQHRVDAGSAPRLSLTKLYERARECALAAEGTDKPKDRERLLKWADEWRAAAREGLTPQRMGSRAA